MHADGSHGCAAATAAVSDLRERVRREAAWRICKKDAFLFAEKHWWIQHPKGSRLFELREPQIEALKLWVSGSNSITLKARQIGWSTLVGFYAFWLAYFNPETKVLFLSKGEREAGELLDKVGFGLDRIPGWMKARGPSITTLFRLLGLCML